MVVVYGRGVAIYGFRRVGQGVGSGQPRCRQKADTCLAGGDVSDVGWFWRPRRGIAAYGPLYMDKFG